MIELAVKIVNVIYKFDHINNFQYCDLQGRKINFINSETLVGWCRRFSRPIVTRVNFDLPECKEL